MYGTPTRRTTAADDTLFRARDPVGRGDVWAAGLSVRSRRTDDTGIAERHARNGNRRRERTSIKSAIMHGL